MSSGNGTGTDAEAGPSGTASTDKHSAPTLRRYEAVLKDEEAYQAAQYASPDDLPGCMRLFDEFISCYALGPQIRNLYRHGELRDCTYKLEDFKYCMSLKGEEPEAKQQSWIKRRAEWWAGRRVSGSSEDVWDRRSHPLPNFPPVYADASPEQTTA